MKKFIEWLNENKLQDFVRSNNPPGSYRPDDPTRYMSQRQKRKMAQQAGLPSISKDDKSGVLTSSFEKLRHHLATKVGIASPGGLVQMLQNVRKKGLFPELFPSQKDVFAGFSPEQIQSLNNIATGLKPSQPTDRQKTIKDKSKEVRRRRAIAKVPFNIRVIVAKRVYDANYDYVRSVFGSTYDDLLDVDGTNPNHPKYQTMLGELKYRGMLGDDAKELSDEWLKRNGYWED